MEDTAPAAVQRYLLELVEATLEDLAQAGCLEVEDDFLLKQTTLGCVASYYYLVRPVYIGFLRVFLQHAHPTKDTWRCN